MESFELYVPALIFQIIHHYLQVLRSTDVTSHDRVIVSVQQQLAQQLNNVKAIKSRQGRGAMGITPPPPRDKILGGHTQKRSINCVP